MRKCHVAQPARVPNRLSEQGFLYNTQPILGEKENVPLMLADVLQVVNKEHNIAFMPQVEPGQKKCYYSLLHASGVIENITQSKYHKQVKLHAQDTDTEWIENNDNEYYVINGTVRHPKYEFCFKKHQVKMSIKN